jgi:uncharacterized protein
MLKEQIAQDLKEAMKAGDAVRVSALRMLSAAFANMEIAKRGQGDLTEADYEAVVKKEAKKNQDSIEAYKLAGRTELQEKEEADLAIISVYLPQMMPETEVAAIVEAVIGELGTGNMGQLIGEVMKRAEGRADGGVVSKLVREKLG